MRHRPDPERLADRLEQHVNAALMQRRFPDQKTVIGMREQALKAVTDQQLSELGITDVRERQDPRAELAAALARQGLMLDDSGRPGPSAAAVRLKAPQTALGRAEELTRLFNLPTHRGDTIADEILRKKETPDAA